MIRQRHRGLKSETHRSFDIIVDTARNADYLHSERFINGPSAPHAAVSAQHNQCAITQIRFEVPHGHVLNRLLFELLETAAADIQPDGPLYGDGLGLDSIDILEIALVVSKRYGLQLRADHEDNTVIFQSLRSLSNHIALQRTK